MILHALEPGLAVLTLTPPECRRLARACELCLREATSPEEIPSTAWYHAAQAAFHLASSAAAALDHITRAEMAHYLASLAD